MIDLYKMFEDSQRRTMYLDVTPFDVSMGFFMQVDVTNDELCFQGTCKIHGNPKLFQHMSFQSSRSQDFSWQPLAVHYFITVHVNEYTIICLLYLWAQSEERGYCQFLSG